MKQISHHKKKKLTSRRWKEGTTVGRREWRPQRRSIIESEMARARGGIELMNLLLLLDR